MSKKTCSDALALPLSALFTLSFTIGQKRAKTDPLNYRPISLHSIISKVMESIIAVDITSLLFSNSLISDHQFRFRHDHSSLDVLLLLSKRMDGDPQYQAWDQGRLLTYLEVLIQYGIQPCFPIYLPMESKANSTHGLLTSSPLVVNRWLSMEPFLRLSCRGWSTSKQCSRPHYIPHFHQRPHWLCKIKAVRA